MPTVIQVLILIALACVTRLLLVKFYRKWIKQGVFGDAAYHYCIIRALCRGPGPYEGVQEFFLKNGPDRYPVLFHRFASLFGLRIVETYSYLPNLVIFAGFTAALPIFIGLLPMHPTSAWLSATPFSTGNLLPILSTVLFVTSVANNSLRGDGVLFLSLSERLLAKLSVGLYYFGALMWQFDGGSPFLIISMTSGYITIATSMFGRQAIFFTTPLWAIIGLDADILLPLAGALLLSALIDGKTFVLGLRDQWDFSKSYRLYTAKSRVFLDSLSKFAFFGNSRSLSSLLTQWINYEPGKSIFRHPDLILVLCVGWGHLPPAFVALLVATIAVYLITTTKRFRHFGESERYLDYTLTFVLPFFLANEVLRQPSIGMALSILYVAVAYRIVLIGMSLWKDAARSVQGSESLNDILQQGSVVKDSRVLPVPINFGQTISARTGSSVVCYPGVYGPWIFEQYIDEYPLFKRPLDRLVTEFRITQIVVNKIQTENLARVVGWSYDFSRYRKVAENEYWCCYDVY